MKTSKDDLLNTRHSLVGPPGLWKMKRDFQINFLKHVGLLPRHELLDIGCGTLRGGIPLIQYLETSHYYGIESRREVLEEGRKELQEAGLEHKLPTLELNAQLSLLEFPVKFPYIWAFSVLIHMSDDILADCLAMVAANLRWDGCFYANVFADGGPDTTWQGFPVVHRDTDFYTSCAARVNLVFDDLGSMKSLGHVSGAVSQDELRMLRFYLDDES